MCGIQSSGKLSVGRMIINIRSTGKEVVKMKILYILLPLILALFWFAIASGQEVVFPDEMKFIQEDGVALKIFECVNRETSEDAICVIYLVDECPYLVVFDEKTAQVREVLKRDGNKTITIYKTGKQTKI